MRIQIAVAIALALFGTGLQKVGAVEETNQAIQRIGIYDSRAVAVAFVGSTQHNLAIKRMIAERDKAKAEGNQRRVAELEAEAHQQQDLRHRQGFSTAPVDDILQQIVNEVEIIKSTRQLTALVSQWDKDSLSLYDKAMKVDVTEQLIDACHPNARQRQAATEIQKVKPIPLKQLERHLGAE